MINRSLTASINFKSPVEVWLGKLSGYKHVRRFGSVVYVYADQGNKKPFVLQRGNCLLAAKFCRPIPRRVPLRFA